MNADEMTLRTKIRSKIMTVRTMQYVGLLMVFGGIGVLGYQSVIWLQTGHWPVYPLEYIWTALGYQPPRIEWVGSKKIVDWFLALPITFPAIALGFVIGGYSAMKADEMEQNERLRQAKVGLQKRST